MRWQKAKGGFALWPLPRSWANTGTPFIVHANRASISWGLGELSAVTIGWSIRVQTSITSPGGGGLGQSNTRSGHRAV